MIHRYQGGVGWYGLIPQDVGQGVTVMDQRIRFISEEDTQCIQCTVFIHNSM
jgi:hypothetical protein